MDPEALKRAGRQARGCLVPLTRYGEDAVWRPAAAAVEVIDALISLLEEVEKDNQIGAAEAEVGRYVYRRIEALMDAKAGSAEGLELSYLARLAEAVEEYGEGETPNQPAEVEFSQAATRLEEAEKALEPFSKAAEFFDSWPKPLPDEAALNRNITAGDLRRAHAAHKRLKGE